jgi:O-antigen chain-terminating methyltransferase
MTERGFDAIGVDLDAGMLEASRALGLKVEETDAVAYMQSLASETVVVVSGFHIAEHLPFGELQQLVQAALRVLVPGGLLILETPNPENISVGSNSFYLDPTHERPLPPQLLSFLPEHYGFFRSKVLCLQESETLRDGSSVGLLDVFTGVSPDYAIVAQKPGAPLITMALDAAFAQSFGVTLPQLAGKYQQFVENRILAVESAAQQAQERAIQAEVASKQAQERAIQAEVIAQAQANQLSDVYNSTSWRITAPLRWPVLQARLLREHGFKRRSKDAVKRVLRTLVQFVVARPSVYHFSIKVANKFGVVERLKPLARKLLVGQSVGAFPFVAVPQATQGSSALAIALNRHAERVYQDLKVVMFNNRDGN